MQGIYKIENINTGKVYIGSSVDIDIRFKQHKYDLESKKHHSIKLQRSWSKTQDPSNTFVFQIIENCDGLNRHELLKREEFLINEYDSIKNGYNVADVFGVLPTKKKTKKKIKENFDIVENEFNQWLKSRKNQSINMKFRIRNRDFSKTVSIQRQEAYSHYKNIYNFVEKHMLPKFKNEIISPFDVVLEILNHSLSRSGTQFYIIAKLKNGKYLRIHASLNILYDANNRMGLTDHEFLHLSMNQSEELSPYLRLHKFDRKPHWLDDRFNYSDDIETPMYRVDCLSYPEK
ncbi:GIY-YIG nuclease family protein [Aquibacillus saliphilus]|uniref:GIY-YIG nuclease family protein n=1 Tax=Aquibacillus saliphilus TaxID=1909422 RepID=UPI001CEFC55E|nr:GIY-YIG nuclease family protein [Aquibacillus saliphilus]